MKTILDQHDELSLTYVIDEDVFLTCHLRPMIKTDMCNIIPNDEHAGYFVKFHAPVGYFVLSESVQIGMEFITLDSYHISIICPSSAIDYFGINVLYENENICHFVIRTAHFFVNVFSECEPVIVPC
jgi:hypothetical protein